MKTYPPTAEFRFKTRVGFHHGMAGNLPRRPRPGKLNLGPTGESRSPPASFTGQHGTPFGPVQFHPG